MKRQLIMLCSAALLCTTALANDNETESRDKKGTFATLDADGDGKLSREEAASHRSLSSNFSALDDNSDGFVSKREYSRNTMPRKKDSDR